MGTATLSCDGDGVGVAAEGGNVVVDELKCCDGVSNALVSVDLPRSDGLRWREGF